MAVPVKVELFDFNDDIIDMKEYEHFRVTYPKRCGFYTERVEALQEDWEIYKDLPTGEELADHFIHKGLPFWQIIYVGDDGDMISRLKISKI